jgi:hypothetical protein
MGNEFEANAKTLQLRANLSEKSSAFDFVVAIISVGGISSNCRADQGETIRKQLNEDC